MSNHIPQIDKRKLLKNFNLAAADYDDISLLQKYTGKELLERLQIVRLEPKRIIDLVSGAGHASMELSALYTGAEIIQLDIAENMVRMSRRTPAAYQSYVCADAEAIPIKKQVVDLVFSNLMLQWSPDPGKLFSDVARVLRPGGLFIFSTLGPDTLRELKESWAAVDNEVHVNTFIDMHDFGDALLASGFAEPVMETDTVIINYETAKNLMLDLKHLGAGNVNRARRKTLTGKTRLLNMYKEYEKKRTGGAIPATYEVIYGHAWMPSHSDEKDQKTHTGSLASLKDKLKSIS